MPYVLKKYEVLQSQKIEEFLQEVVSLPEQLSIKLLQKGRIIDDRKRRLQKGQVVKSGYIEVSVFEAITKGLKPIFQTEHFALFDKPSGLLVHPVARSTQYTLLDEIRYYLGKQANLVHRIDAETSGLVLVSKNKYAQFILNEMFEKKEFVKKYKAIVQGEVKENILIDKKILPSNGKIKVKMTVSDTEGKESMTLIHPLCYDRQQNQTLVEAIPYTGRQHQIRVHLNSINHRIIGDPIYGLDEDFVDSFLQHKISKEERKKITEEKRLMLHAFYLEFTFLNREFKFCSKQAFP